MKTVLCGFVPAVGVRLNKPICGSHQLEWRRACARGQGRRKQTAGVLPVERHVGSTRAVGQRHLTDGSAQTYGQASVLGDAVFPPSARLAAPSHPTEDQKLP
ncbi:unnamed protein product [Arctogadus glacialis]